MAESPVRYIPTELTEGKQIISPVQYSPTVLTEIQTIDEVTACSPFCEAHCEATCEYSCQSCENPCQRECERICQSTCESCQNSECGAGCQNTCQFYCQNCEICEGCQGACEKSCQNCQTTCEKTCQSCESGCQGCETTCENSCQNCEGDCMTGCEAGCEEVCEDGCQRYCEGACELNCQIQCEDQCEIGCEGGCMTVCERNCQSECEIGNCQNCESSCQFCETGCEITCQEVCQIGCEVGTQENPPQTNIADRGKNEKSITVRAWYQGVTPAKYCQFYCNSKWFATVESSSGSTNWTTPEVTKAGLEPNTTYSFYAIFKDASYHVIGSTQTIEITTLQGARPDDWNWSYNISSGGSVYNTSVAGNTIIAYIMPASEWNNFTKRINDFRAYKGLSNYSFTSISSDSSCTPSIINQAVNAINDMGFSISTVSSGNVPASVFNQMRDKLNSIP